MDQPKVIETLYRWLQSNRWSDSLLVKCDHVTEAREELGLFIGPKLPGKGRGSRIAQVDIVVCNEAARAVELVIEVDPNPNPKKLMGDIMAALLADNYTPSNSFAPYKIDNTIFVFLTVLDQRHGSQKAKQFELIEQRLRQKIDLADLGIRNVHLCYGGSDNEAINHCKETLGDYFLKPGHASGSCGSPLA